jgi:hypothetical protein
VTPPRPRQEQRRLSEGRAAALAEELADVRAEMRTRFEELADRDTLAERLARELATALVRAMNPPAPKRKGAL